jgi:hypothetical protein
VDRDCEIEGISPALCADLTSSIMLPGYTECANPGSNSMPALDISGTFKQTIAQLGASSAIITYVRFRPVLRRQFYMIGLDAFAGDAHATRAVLNFSESCWLRSAENGSLVISTSDVPTVPQLKDMLAPFGQMVFSTYSSDANGQFRIALFRKKELGAFDTNLMYNLSLLQPILADIAATQIDVQRAQRRVGIMEGMLDSVSHGVILLDARAHPFYSNDVARRLIAETGVFTVGNDQILRCRSTESTQALHRAIHRTVSAESASNEAIVKLTSRDGNPVLCFITPACGRDGDTDNRAAFLILHDMKVHAASPALMQAFGLLPSEQRFLSTFLEAPSLAKAALLLNLSEETARTYLKRICAKMGVRRQVELASLMFGLAPPIRQPADASHAAY